MKKNLLSIVILALLVVNLILSGIMMFSVMSTNKKTAAVVTDIASILKLELGTGSEGESPKHEVSIEDTQVYNIEEEMQIVLTKEPEDEKEHIALVQVALSMDTKDKGYKSYGSNIADRESLIKGTINEVIGSYTADEIKPKSDEIKGKILDELHELFDGSEFIYDITFSKMFVQ